MSNYLIKKNTYLTKPENTNHLSKYYLRISIKIVKTLNYLLNISNISIKLSIQITKKKKKSHLKCDNFIMKNL